VSPLPGRAVNPEKDREQRAGAGQAICRASGKRIYGSRKLARRARMQLVRGHELNVYSCEHCAGYHIGHMPREVRNGELDKDVWLSRTSRPRRS